MKPVHELLDFDFDTTKETEDPRTEDAKKVSDIDDKSACDEVSPLTHEVAYEKPDERPEGNEGKTEETTHSA